jgi:hypothetical protein
MISARAVLGFEVTDDGLDGGASSHLPFDLFGHAPFLSGGVNAEAIIGWSFVAAVACVGEDAVERGADLLLHFGDHCRERVAVPRGRPTAGLAASVRTATFRLSWTPVRARVDLVGHDREAPTGFSGPCRLDGGVEGNQIGLLRRRGDQLNHVADPGRRA